MFTLDQIDDIHERYGDEETLGQYLRALHAIGVVRCASFISDGHSVYTGTDGSVLTSPPAHEEVAIAGASDADAFRQVMAAVERGELGYLEMCRQLGAAGVEQWVFDTVAVTMAYLGIDGAVLLEEALD